MSHYSPHMQVMMDAVRKTARRLMRDHADVERLQVSKKGPRDFVSTADLKAEEILVDILQEARPDYGFLIEERGEIEGKSQNYRWIIDPLDGTSNFLHGLPFFCISVALEKREGDKSEIIAGVVAAPALQETFWAEKGKGAWVEKDSSATAYRQSAEERLRVSARSNLDEALVARGGLRASNDEGEKVKKVVEHVTEHATIRLMGVAALELAYVAAGRIDLCVHSNLKPWDIAAGQILIREAGGKITDIHGGDAMFNNGSVVAGNLKMHGQVLKS